jgi:hypothetical protein
MSKVRDYAQLINLTGEEKVYIVPENPISGVGGYWTTIDDIRENEFFYVLNGTNIDDTTALQNSINFCAANNKILVLKGLFKSNTVDVTNPIEIVGINATIEKIDDANDILININSSNVSIENVEFIDFKGVVNSFKNTIEIKGTVLTPIKNIKITNCIARDGRGTFVWTEFVHDSFFLHNQVSNYEYGGFLHLSAKNIKTDNNIINNIGISHNTDAYGIAYTRTENDSLINYPKSINSTANYNSITNIPAWEALDTHGGENLEFNNNFIDNCLVGIAIVNADGHTTNELFEANYVIAKNNNINNCSRVGIAVKGNGITTYAKGIIISENIIKRCGVANDANFYPDGCAILVKNFVENCIVSLNNIIEPYQSGITVINDVLNINIIGNNISNTQTSVFSANWGILISNTNNSGIIANNNILRNNLALNTYVGKRGIAFSSINHVNSFLIQGNNSTYEIPYLTTFYQNSYTGLLSENGAKLLSGNGTPEGFVTAPRGSQFTRINGGANTTLYIKETASGNTGWRAI